MSADNTERPGQEEVVESPSQQSQRPQDDSESPVGLQAPARRYEEDSEDEEIMTVFNI